MEWLVRWPGSIGTWVRIPGPPKHLFYFSSYIHMQISKGMSTICFKPQHARCLQAWIQWPKLKDHHTPWSTSTRWIPRVKAGWMFWAWKLLIILPLQAHTPLSISLHFISFSYLFILFILLS